ncbi:conserved hypothetical protein [Leishmania mexicana MHOM/GT/2001/U1103]|uniref:Uncharacterized protein n=1 Tax=Leishmania mexicana (strain MHOM/GT/2001/U1103) TaxID=929439 RepID=E9B4M5_LEIMU|nr:conserved hypothetical protein [Leishmania mexicana MHOM/GT/2001/U1103]CBZ30194.1 conserved hypothetical protein [Leishmania mexicana MHOM/GT/2001/U1103]
MRSSAAARTAGKGVCSQHGSVAARRKVPKDVFAGGVAGQSTPTRSRQAEAVVRHVAQLPAFVAWAPGNAATTPSLVGKYLEFQVAEVAAQLNPIQQSGNYERLTLLLTELLQRDLVAGVTPCAVQCGVLHLIHACVAAIAKGEVGVYDNQRSSGRETSLAAAAAAAASVQCARSPRTAFGSTSKSTRQGGGGAVPIENLLPPLIEQPEKSLRDGRHDTGAAVTEDERAAIAMEAWEHYMATARKATSAEDALMIPGPTAAATMISSASCANAAHSCTSAVAAEAPLAFIRSFPDALCALIERCTATPLVCLTLSDQQCQTTAVRDLLRALLTIMQGIDGNAVAAVDCDIALASHSSSSGHRTPVTATAALDLQAVRLAALKGVSRVLTTYLDGADGSAQAPKKASATLTAGLDRLDILSVFEDVVHQWASVLTVLATEKGLSSASAGVGKGVDVKAEDDLFGAAGSPQGRRSSTDGNGAAAQLHWVLRITCQIIAAEQRETSCGGAEVTPRVGLLPPLLVPVALRTLSLTSTAIPLVCRAASYAQLCVDVLWGASLLAPSESSRQLMYGSMGVAGLAGASNDSCEGEAGVSRGAEASPPAMDLFLGLLHQFNEGHSAAHCELRDDLVCLFAFLLRCDIQYVEDELAAHRVAQNGTPLTSSESLSCLSAAPPSVEVHVTPLNLSVATVEAINAVAALLFETTCGAELTTTAHSATATAPAAFQSTDVDRGESTPVALLSLDAARRHALRFQSIASSVARRRKLLDFKIYGWQLLDAHYCWQLAHLTYREYVHYHITTGPIKQVTGTDAGDGAVTAALWGIQLSRLGFLDVLLMYVDTRTDEAAVVAWTQEELLKLEVEAWQLLTSMILFTQHLGAKSDGLQVRCHSLYSEKPSAPQDQQQGEDSPLLSVPVEAVDKHHFGEEAEDRGSDMDSTDDKPGMLYGADMHFIAAGGVEVALHYLRTAPLEAEAVKRCALVTVAAIARASRSGEVHGRSGRYTDEEVALVQTALTQHAPSLVPFLVQLIREIDVYVDASGVPATVPPLISSITASVAATSLQRVWGHRSVREDSGIELTAATPTYGEVRWNWLPQTAAHAAFVAWGLLRCIGDVVLAEVGTVRELALPMMTTNDIEEDDHDDEAEDTKMHKSHSNVSIATAANTVDASKRKRVGRDRTPLRSFESADWQPHEEVDLCISSMSSSGSSMGPLEVDGNDDAVGAHRRPAASSRAAGDSESAACSINCVSAPSHTRVLLGSVHSPVLRIPNLFAEHGGVDLLTSWMRHVMRQCLSARPEQQHRRSEGAAPQLTMEEVANLERYGDVFLLLLDVLRAIVMGCKASEMQFVESGGVQGMLDLMEAYALAHGLIGQAARHVRLTAVESCGGAAAGTADHKEQEGVLMYATTLLSDLLESCPRAIDPFATWRSCRIALSPLTPDVRECRLSSDDGIEAVQLLLCLWASEMPAGKSGGAAQAPPSGLMLLHLHLRPALRTALREEYVCRLLHRRAMLGALEADAIRSYYRYLHSEAVPVTTSQTPEAGVPDSVVLAYMEKFMSRRSRRPSVEPEQQISLLIDGALGLCMKVYGCLSTVGFDLLRTAEAGVLAMPSIGARLSSLERSLLLQIAALPALCVDEISLAMAEVALEYDSLHARADSESSDTCFHASDDVAMWLPTSPDRRVLCAAAQEAAVRAGELDQLIEVGEQVQQARESQLYSRFLVTQLRQPVGRLADGRPGAVKGWWKTQRHLPATRESVVAGNRKALALSAAELAARLSTRLAAGQLQLQQFNGTQTGASVGEEQSWASPPSTAPSVLGSSRTPYASLMDSVNAATHERLSATLFSIVGPPQRPSVPLTQRHQQRQAMIARSLRKLPLDQPSPKSPHKP